jgi:hypothetical protein
MQNGRPLLPSPDRVTFSDDAKMLYVNPVLSDNHGNYQCRVSNAVSAMTAAYNLTVNCEYRAFSLLNKRLWVRLFDQRRSSPNNDTYTGSCDADVMMMWLLVVHT